MAKHKHSAIFFFSSKARLEQGFHLRPVARHAGAFETLSVPGSGYWQIVEETEPNVFTPATELFPPDGLWNDGNTANPGDEGYDYDFGPLLAQLDALQTEHGRSFGANYQWPA